MAWWYTKKRLPWMTLAILVLVVVFVLTGALSVVDLILGQAIRLVLPS